MGEFIVGANLPWLDYGLDFGANAWRPGGGISRPEQREGLRRALASLAEAGASHVRWWLFADLRAGVREDAKGRPLGLDPLFAADLDAGLAALREAGLRAVFVLTDFLLAARRRRLEGVRMGGRGSLIRDPRRRAAFFDLVLTPVLDRCGREPVVAAWDVINEPEWATLGLGTFDAAAAVTVAEMRAFIREATDRIHGRSAQPVTAGLASIRWLDLVTDLGLDLYEVHWYDALDPVTALARPVDDLGLDRPILLGEYPTRGSALTPETILDLARRSGYAGAFAWSALARDAATDGHACRAGLRVQGRAEPPGAA